MCKKIFLIYTSFDFFYMQTSKAFEILDSQLSIIFSMSNLFIGEVSSQILSGDQQLQISHHKREGSQIVEDNEETNSIDFVSLLQKFKDVQRQHQEHVRTQMYPPSSTKSILSQVFSTPQVWSHCCVQEIRETNNASPSAEPGHPHSTSLREA